MYTDFRFHLKLLPPEGEGGRGDNNVLISRSCGHITHLHAPWLPFPSLTRFPCILHILALTWLDHPFSHGFPLFLISSFYSLICCSFHVSALFLSLIAPALFLSSVSFSSSSPVWTKGFPAYSPPLDFRACAYLSRSLNEVNKSLELSYPWILPTAS